MDAKLHARGQTALITKSVRSSFMNADKSRLRMVLENIIDNASKYSISGTQIEITLSRSRGSLIIAIKDSGIGIEKKDMPKLFKKFVTDSDFGTGLGLYISKKLVEAHGGRIWAFNNNDGIGCTFVFSLPK